VSVSRSELLVEDAPTVDRVARDDKVVDRQWSGFGEERGDCVRDRLSDQLRPGDARMPAAV
jgi:hypothetical protein